MPIVYDKLWKLLKERGISSYTVQKTHLLSRSTEIGMKALKRAPDYRVLCRLCEVLECQPGDIMEYIPEAEWKRLHPDQDQNSKAGDQ